MPNEIHFGSGYAIPQEAIPDFSLAFTQPQRDMHRKSSF